MKSGTSPGAIQITCVAALQWIERPDSDGDPFTKLRGDTKHPWERDTKLIINDTIQQLTEFNIVLTIEARPHGYCTGFCTMGLSMQLLGADTAYAHCALILTNDGVTR